MKRALGKRHYDVQLIGGTVLHRGSIAEMKTGEGKTFAAPLAAYLNGLTGRGVHVVTVNDYLAKRDAQWIGAVFHRLGMAVGSIQHDTAYIYDPDFPRPMSGCATCGRSRAVRPMPPKSRTAPTMSSASTTCGTTWSSTWRSVSSGTTSSPSWMRSTTS